MKLQQLEYVCQVARTGSISRAARALYTAQSNVSSAISALEEELGYAIFERTPTGVRLTAAGEQLLHTAREMLRLADQARQIGAAGRSAGTLSLAAGNGSMFCQPFLQLCREQPAARLSLYSTTRAQLCKWVLQGKCDFGINAVEGRFLSLFLEDIRSQGLKVRPLGATGLYLRLAEDHPALERLCRDGGPDLTALADHPYINSEESDSMIRYILREVLGRELKEQKQIHITDRAYKYKIIAATGAWTVGIGRTAEEERGSGVTRIPIPGLSLQLLYVCRPGHSPSALEERYLQLLDRQLREIGEFDE